MIEIVRLIQKPSVSGSSTPSIVIEDLGNSKPPEKTRIMPVPNEEQIVEGDTLIIAGTAEDITHLHYTKGQ